MDLMKYPGEIVRMPFNLVRPVAEYGRSVVGQTVGIFFSSETSEDLARKLAGEHVLQQTEVAIDIVHAAQDADMPAIEFDAQEMLADIVIDAKESKCVPAAVTDEIVEKVVELVPDPLLVPTLSDEKAKTFEATVKKVINRRKVRRLFPK